MATKPSIVALDLVTGFDEALCGAALSNLFGEL
jgi:hypothetical protein